MSTLRPLLNRTTAALAPFVDAGVLDAADIHVADAIARLAGGIDNDVLLAAALAVRAPRFGHVAMAPDTVATSVVVDDAAVTPHVASLPWPDPVRWAARIANSPAVSGVEYSAPDTIRPLVWDGRRLYLQRYWCYEDALVGDLLRRAGSTASPSTSHTLLPAILDNLFGTCDPPAVDQQRTAADHAVTHHLTIVSGGPGTGKTRTVARLVAAAHQLALGQHRSVQVALAAPTGKAASRMTAAVHGEIELAGLPGTLSDILRSTEATTLHRLIGLGREGRPVHDRANPLPHDMVVVDESSMVSLPLLGRLLRAMRDDSALVLVGDPYQLASVEAGAVLGEIVGAAGVSTGPLSGDIVHLRHVHRFGADSAIATLAEAVRIGGSDQAMQLLRHDRTGQLTWVDGEDADAIERLRHDTGSVAADVRRYCEDGDAAGGLRLVSDRKVLCATRSGPLGVSHWTERIEAADTRPVTGRQHTRPPVRSWYLGRPIIVTENDYRSGLFNGDVGLVVAVAGTPTVAFDTPTGLRYLAASQVGHVETWWAMTIHKSQGSEFRDVIVSLPPPPSPALTRELLYTAVTRAREHVTVVATEAAIRAAIARPVARTSGIGPRLWPSPRP